MIPVGAPIVAWTNARGPLRGVMRGSQPLKSGARLYIITFDAEPRAIWEIEERFVFDVTDLVRKPSQFSREVGTS
jgi:hypothetical protein